VALARRPESVHTTTDRQGASSASWRTVYGQRGSVTEATWSPGYQFQPQTYGGDRFVHVLDGELCAFLIDGRGRRYSFAMRPGDFLRVPSMAVHWLANRSANECHWAMFSCPGVQWFSDLGPTAVELLGPWEKPRYVERESVPGTLLVDKTNYPVSETEENPAYIGSDGPGLFKGNSQIPSNRVDNPDGTWLSTKIVYASGASVMEGTRPGGYHSRPHVHACEQINLVLKGVLWGYVIDPSGTSHAFELSPGAFWRVPAMAVHWIFNRSDDSCELIELHTPGLQDDPKLRGGAVPLLADYEQLVAREGLVSNIYVQTSPHLVADSERAASATA